MSCTPGCCPSPRAHYQSIGTSINPPTSKTTTDVHDNHTVDVTESRDRQDVAVKLQEPLRMGTRVDTPGKGA